MRLGAPYVVCKTPGCGRWTFRERNVSVCWHCYVRSNEALPCQEPGCKARRWKDQPRCRDHYVDHHNPNRRDKAQ